MRLLRRGPSIDRETAETLVRRRHATSGGGAPDARGRAVEALLAAATAPGRPSELAGEQAAIAAFRCAGLAVPGPTATGVVARLRGAVRWVAVVQAAAAVGLAAGSVAVASLAGGGSNPPRRPPAAAASSPAPGPVAGDAAPTPPIVTADPSTSSAVPDPIRDAGTGGHHTAAAPSSGATGNTVHTPPATTAGKHQHQPHRAGPGAAHGGHTAGVHAGTGTAGGRHPLKTTHGGPK